ncbi:hypothetical protein Vretifemale_7321 [Volvox reticuliferus]|nr:hypothetical protein Vretifemale_7321 [Volvox reticuliferus]
MCARQGLCGCLAIGVRPVRLHQRAREVEAHICAVCCVLRSARSTTCEHRTLAPAFSPWELCTQAHVASALTTSVPAFVFGYHGHIGYRVPRSDTVSGKSPSLGQEAPAATATTAPTVSAISSTALIAFIAAGRHLWTCWLDPEDLANASPSLPLLPPPPSPPSDKPLRAPNPLTGPFPRPRPPPSPRPTQPPPPDLSGPAVGATFATSVAPTASTAANLVLGMQLHD